MIEGQSSPRTVPPARARRKHVPPGWDTSSPEYEFLPLKLPKDVTRVTASMRLAIEAEFGGWELSRLRLYPDGTRRVLLRRKRPRGAQLAGDQSPAGPGAQER